VLLNFLACVTDAVVSFLACESHAICMAARGPAAVLDQSSFMWPLPVCLQARRFAPVMC
jgi:hypothetical protein